MFEDKRINYAIGIIFGTLILGFLGAPFLGDANGYDMLGLIKISSILNESIILAFCAFEILVIIFASISILLGISGIILKSLSPRFDKIENIISWTYSAIILAVTVFEIIMLSLILAFDLNTVNPQYGFFVLLGLNALLPYFSETKLSLVTLVYMILMISWIGLAVFVIEDKVTKRRKDKKSQVELQGET